MAVPRGRVGRPGPEARGPHPGGPGAGTGRDGATRPSGDGGMESEARCPVWEPQCGVSSRACAPGASSNGGRAPAAERWMGRQPPTTPNPDSPRVPTSIRCVTLRPPPPGRVASSSTARLRVSSSAPALPSLRHPRAATYGSPGPLSRSSVHAFPARVRLGP